MGQGPMQLGDVGCSHRENALLAEEPVYEEFDRATVFALGRRLAAYGHMFFQEPRPELLDRERLPKRVALGGRIRSAAVRLGEQYEGSSPGHLGRERPELPEHHAAGAAVPAILDEKEPF